MRHYFEYFVYVDALTGESLFAKVGVVFYDENDLAIILINEIINPVSLALAKTL